MKTGNTGNLKLARPLGGLTTLRDYDPYISDLAALLTGVKPLIYIDFDISGWPYIRELCRRFKLKYLFPEDDYHKTGFHIRKGKKTAIFGYDAAKIREAARLWSVGTVGVPWGVALGYPQCCVEAYTRWQCKASAHKKCRDLIKMIAGRTRAGGRLDFTLNNVYNYYSRIMQGPPDQAMHEKMHVLNADIVFPNLQVISWHPCAYDCPKSTAAGGRIFAFMEYYLPGYARHLKEYLARPVIFFDKYEFVTLDGRVRAGRLDYRGTPAPVSLAPSGWLDKIRALSSLKKNGVRSLEIKKLLSADWRKKPEFLDFSG